MVLESIGVNPCTPLRHVSQKWKHTGITNWRANEKAPAFVYSPAEERKKTVKMLTQTSSLLGDINRCSRDLRPFPHH